MRCRNILKLTNNYILVSYNRKWGDVWKNYLCLLQYFLVSILLTACTKNVENQKLTLKFDFGSREGTYTGELKNDLPNGNGRFDTKNKEGIKWYYDGEWVDGIMEGQGMQCWEEID